MRRRIHPLGEPALAALSEEHLCQDGAANLGSESPSVMLVKSDKTFENIGRVTTS